MEAIGSEVGQKMRSAIKAKLMELGCYVDDELPDYVMVMVANKRTRSQMEDDLQLFLTNNTAAFVGWLHQVLQKLQEVTINKKLLTSSEKKTKSSKSVDVKKERKEKDKKKDKPKSKDKEKTKSKDKHSKKSKKHSSSDNIRPNVPPIYMNLAKESSPSITDVFAGQILKTHGLKSNVLEKDLANDDSKSKINDPQSSNVPSTSVTNDVNHFDVPSLTEIEKERDKLAALPREEQIKEYNEINAKIQSLKKKLVEQLDSGSEDEDFINLRTEAEELIGVDLSDELEPIPRTLPTKSIAKPSASLDKSPSKSVSSPDSLQNSSLKTPPSTRKHTEGSFYEGSSEISTKKLRTPIRAPSPDKPRELPIIELNLPKRPMRDRLGIKSSVGYGEANSSKTNVNKVNPFQASVNRTREEFGNDRSRSDNKQNKMRSQNDKSNVRNKLNRNTERSRKESSNNDEAFIKRRIGSRVFPIPPAPEEEETKNNLSVASVVRAPPRPAGPTAAPASQLLLRAVADAHKSLLTMPPKNNETKKKAFVLPIRRNIDPMKIIIQVPSENIPISNSRDSNREYSDDEIDIDTESLGELESDGDGKKMNMEYIPEPLKKSNEHINKVDYVPSHIDNIRVEVPVISRVLHLKNEKAAQMRKDPQFVVTLEGVNPNMFLEKKLSKEIEEEEKNSNKLLQQNTSDHAHDANGNAEKPDREENQMKNVKCEMSGDIGSIRVQIQSDGSKKEEIKQIEINPSKSSDKLENSSSKSRKSITKITFSESKKINEKKFSSKETTSPLNVVQNKGIKRKPDEEDEKSTKQKRSLSPIVFDKVEESQSNSKYSILPPLNDKKLKKMPFSRESRCKFYPDCALGPACEFYHPPMTPSPSAGCRSFPNCPYGDKCTYGHPPCKFDVLCTRTGCPYSHNATQHKTNKLISQVSPGIASRVVPVQNYKTISSNPLPAICKFYPNCTNPSCHFFHPKPCRFGKSCLNKIECNFYHHDLPTSLKYYS